ncbi:MAG: tRNA lysidine(34) synthetase TilS [Lactobacillaceae bacterium]|jgi:tRNA(Ile)-lysidine synthase|nr:tRNA lysidine(34) synthetase TilS [Lactobacillaceae bacterium]
MQAKVLRANLIQHIRSNQLLSNQDHVVVAVSGGFDSLHLLTWLTDGNLPVDIQPTVSAVYINHQLRADAADEEKFMRSWFDSNADRLAHFAVERVQWEVEPTHAVEEQARDRRYQLLAHRADEWQANKIVTAHHQDDQVETILFKLIRGGRLSQLQGMAELQQRGRQQIVRPFLHLTKQILPSLIDTQIMEWVEDYTNNDESFARNKLRQTILPELRVLNQAFDQHLLATMQQIDALQTLAEPAMQQAINAIEAGTYSWNQPDAATLLVMQQWVTHQGYYEIKDSQLRQALQLMRNQSVNRGTVDLEGALQFVRAQNKLLIQSK